MKRILIYSSILILFVLYASLNSPVWAAVAAGDANGDGRVDETDYGIWLSHYSQSVTGGVTVGDFDGNGTVDGVDYSIWLLNYGSTAVTTSPAPTTTPITSCLDTAGPVITLSGSKTGYANKTLADQTKINATTATFTNGGQNPVRFGVGADNCWHSGKIYGGYPLDASWATTHPTAGIWIYDYSVRPIIEGIYADQIGDGVKVYMGESSGQAGIAEPFTVRDSWLRDIRDDCIESDFQAGAYIYDNLLDGCYTVFATQKRSSATTNGSNNVWEIRNVLAYMHDQIGVYKGTSPGHSMFFKWDSTSPKWKMYNSILRVDSAVSESSEQFDFRLDKMADCANNTLVWLGSGSFPGTLPSCFTITTDKSVWDNAVTAWKIRHGVTQ